jgi:hypothetical protein
MYSPINKNAMKYNDVELFIFQKGINISGKFEVVNKT